MYSSPVSMCIFLMYVFFTSNHVLMYVSFTSKNAHVCMYSLQVITHIFSCIHSLPVVMHIHASSALCVLCIPVFATLMLGISKLPLPERYIMESITAGYWMCLCRQVLRMSRVQTDESNTFRYWRGNHPSDDVHFD